MHSETALDERVRAVMTRRRHRVLVAEDHPSIRNILCHVLQQGGFATIEAADGLEAVEMARSHRPDAIVLDVTMPVMDGVSACRMIRSDPDTAGIPVAICTSRDRQADVLKALSAGADDYLLKPFRVDMVLARVRRLLESRRRQRATERRESTRVAVDWGVEGAAAEDDRWQACTRDVSTEGIGACVGTDRAADWREGESMHLWLRVGPAAVVEAIARIAHRTPAPADRTVVGMSFTEISEPARRMIALAVVGRGAQPA